MSIIFNPNDHMFNLKGKDYLEVKWRLVWFRAERPNWSIMTEVIKLEDTKAVFVARIVDPEGSKVIATGHGSETQKDFADFIEKAETKAVGRALAMLGYGTQFAPELEEGERIVDAPVVSKATTTKAIKQGSPPETAPTTVPDTVRAVEYLKELGVTKKIHMENLLSRFKPEFILDNGVLMSTEITKLQEAV